MTVGFLAVGLLVSFGGAVALAGELHVAPSGNDTKGTIKLMLEKK